MKHGIRDGTLDISSDCHTEERNGYDGTKCDANIDEDTRRPIDIEEATKQSEQRELDEVDDHDVDSLNDRYLFETLWSHADQPNVVHMLPITNFHICAISAFKSEYQ